MVMLIKIELLRLIKPKMSDKIEQVRNFRKTKRNFPRYIRR